MKKILLAWCLIVGSIAASHSQTSHPAPASDPAGKAKGLQKQLKLTDSQTSKVAVIYQESAQKFEKIKTQDHGNTDKMITDIRPLRVSTIKKIRALLTPVQALSYDKLVKEPSSSGLNGGWSGGWGSSE